MYTVMGVLALVVSALFPVAILAISDMFKLSQPFVGNIYMMLFIIAFVGIYFWIVRVQNLKKLVVLFLVIFYAATQYLLVNMTMPLLTKVRLKEIYYPSTLFLFAVATVLLFPFMAFLMRRAVKDYLVEIEIHNIRREFTILVVVTLFYLTVLFLYSSKLSILPSKFWWWVAPLFLLVIVILFYFYWILFRESVRRRRDSEYQRTLEIQQLQYEKITAEVDNVCRMRHDMRHHLNRIYDMLEHNKLEETKVYLSDVIGNTEKQENKIYCYNVTVNAMLQFYIGQAENEDIRCEVQAECGELNIMPVDLTVLFGNAMENAIHACMKFENNRWLKIEIGIIGGSFMVQISNPCEEIYPSESYKADGGFLPADAFLSEHAGGGYGLWSIEHTAEKYGGGARFQFDEKNKIFITRIRLNINSEIVNDK